MLCVRDAVGIGLRKRTRATKINHYVENAEVGDERRNSLKGKAGYGDNMTKRPMIYWCVRCNNQASVAGRDEMTCIRCLRNIIKNNIDEIEQPLNYEDD